MKYRVLCGLCISVVTPAWAGENAEGGILRASCWVLVPCPEGVVSSMFVVLKSAVLSAGICPVVTCS
jgi:hypothetical protein